MAGEHLARLVGGQLVAHERLRLRHDLAHPGVDPFEVVLHEGGPAGQLEVVVEAVLDRRPDAERGAGEQVEHRLGQHVGRGVADREQPAVAVAGDDGDLVAVVQLRGQVALLAVDDRDHGRLGQAGADVLGQTSRGGAGGQRTRRTIGQPDRDLLGHGPDGTGGVRGVRNRFREPERRQDRGCEHVGARAAGRGLLGRPVAVGAGGLELDHVGGLGGRDALGLLRGVLVDVLLARELADLVHHLVDDLPEHQPVVGAVDVAADVDRAAEAHLGRLERPRQLGVGRLDLAGADHPDGDDRRAGAQGEASRPRCGRGAAARRGPGCPRGRSRRTRPPR